MSDKYDSYLEYKDTGIYWLPAVPIDWQILPLKFASANKVKDGPHETPKFLDEGVPFFSVDGIQDCKLVFDGCRYISHEDHERFSMKCLPKFGDVLLGKAASVGKVAFVDTKEEFNVWSPLAVLTPKSVKLGRFIFYSFQSTWLQAQCDVNSNSNTQKNLSMGVIDNLSFAIPSDDVADKIANFLDHETAKIDTLIEKQQQLIKLLKEKRQAVISHAVTKGLNPNAPMLNSGVAWLDVVPEHWDVCRVKQISSFITSGPRGWSDYLTDSGKDIFLQSGDLNNKLGLQFSKANKVTPPNNAEGVRTKLKHGDIVVCITGANTGRVAVTPELTDTVYINQHLSLIRPIKKLIDSKYLGFVLSSSSVKSYFSITQYGLKEGLSLSNVGEAPLCCPPLDEQKAIVKYIKSINSKYDSLELCTEKQVNLLRERRNSLISAAVTGEIDVRNWQPPKSSVKGAIYGE